MFNNNSFNNAPKNQSGSAENPFKQEEVLQAWLENDSDYNKAKLKIKKTLQLNNPNKLMSFNPYINFVNYITKHAILATLIMFLAIGTLSASALEAFGPNEYKPSTISKNLFNANKQPDKDPYTALKADSNNDVANLEACDLSIKFPKKINGKNVEVYNEKRYQGNDLINYFTLTDSYEFTREYTNQIIKGEAPNVAFSRFDISCDRIQNNFQYSGYETRKIETNELREKTGWLITEAELDDIAIINAGESNDSNNYIYFKYRGVRYNISYLNKSYTGTFNPVKILPEIQPEQVQIQFNSIVKNQSTKTVLEAPNVAKPEANKPQETPKTNPINIELKNSTGLVKYISLPDKENLDIDGKPFMCGTQFVTVYTKEQATENDDFRDMYVSNTNLGLNLEQKQSYQNVLDLVARKKNYPTVNGLPNDFFGPFDANCSGFGFSYKFLEAPQILYPNTDSSITLYTLEGNGEVGTPTVRIFATKGDNLITIARSLVSYDTKATFNKCTIKNAQGETVDNICYEDTLKADPKLKQASDKAAQELVQIFAIK